MTRQKATESSGNVFADLGFPDAEELNLKAGLAVKLAEVMRLRGLNQTSTARLTGISQPDLSRILRGHLREVSADRLIRALTQLESEVDISVRHQGRAVGAPIHLDAIAAA
jgi:predicted XRE-type DNA-binding protein